MRTAFSGSKSLSIVVSREIAWTNAVIVDLQLQASSRFKIRSAATECEAIHNLGVLKTSVQDIKPKRELRPVTSASCG